MNRHYETEEERKAWLNHDFNLGLYKIAIRQRPKKELVHSTYKKTKDQLA